MLLPPLLPLPLLLPPLLPLAPVLLLCDWPVVTLEAPFVLDVAPLVPADTPFVPDAPLEVSLPQPLRSGVETAAARAGLTPSAWLLSLVSRNLAPPNLKAV